MRTDRPRLYNRLWHLDADDRRHRGRRRWEAGIIDAFVDLAGAVDCLYPPDWSDKSRVRFRIAGQTAAFAEIHTGRADSLAILLHPRSPAKLRVLAKSLKLPLVKATESGRDVLMLRLRRQEQIDSPTFRKFFAACARAMR